jgi:hypothetical protein
VGSVKVTKVALALRNSLESSRQPGAGNLGVAGLASFPVADHGNLPSASWPLTVSYYGDWLANGSLQKPMDFANRSGEQPGQAARL